MKHWAALLLSSVYLRDWDHNTVTNKFIDLTVNLHMVFEYQHLNIITILILYIHTGKYNLYINKLSFFAKSRLLAKHCRVVM